MSANKTVLIRFRLNREIYYQDIRLSINQHTVENADSLNKYIARYFELNQRRPQVAAFFVNKILRS